MSSPRSARNAAVAPSSAGAAHGSTAARVLPGQLLEVGDAGALAATVEVEEPRELVHFELLLIAVAPAEAREEADHRLGEIAEVAVREDRRRAVALAELLSVGPVHHG